jgi:hypothetical protein
MYLSVQHQAKTTLFAFFEPIFSSLRLQSVDDVRSGGGGRAIGRRLWR